jgi:exodeoxyribonuclease VII small subunit
MKKKFEDGLDELGEIAEKLESGNLELDTAIALYEKGMKLVSECEKQLADAETSVKIIGLSGIKGGNAE